jgi:hypothetical protein
LQISVTCILPWERVLWSGRPAWPWRVVRARELYFVTDFRVIVEDTAGIGEIAAHDIEGADLLCSSRQRLLGVSTLVVRSRRQVDPRLVLRDIRHGPQLALVVQLLASERHIDDTLLRDASGKGAADPFHPRRTLTLLALTLAGASALGGVVVGHTGASPVDYPPNDAIAPSGHKRSRAEIVAFMEREVMPFAKRALAPVVGSADRVTCATCHGKDAATRDWKMPGVNALPEPELRQAGLERSGRQLDAQIRNAIYGYLANEDHQGTMGYMRSVVMPGMATLLNRPAYDFTRSYDYNRSHAAVGCYHCHRIE